MFLRLLGIPFLLTIVLSCGRAEEVTIISDDNTAAAARLTFGASRLVAAMKVAGYHATHTTTQRLPDRGMRIIVAGPDNDWADRVARQAGIRFATTPGKEGFSIRSADSLILIRGADASGALYGSLALADLVKERGTLPEQLDMTDQPDMVMRGAVVGLQKTEYLPGRKVYEYPYTPDNFPWFYDKQLWIRYLDMLVENRMNSLYLWNGHPFASLVKVDDYPYAVEVDKDTFARNEEMYGFITEEADKRGIWVIQMFYNVIVSQSFADKHGLETQDRSRPITPLIADYTRKSIAAFIEQYPNVGLLVTLGEAMDTVDDDVEWFTKTIIPGVKDGLKALGRADEPPILLRAHDTDAVRVMEQALPLYRNLYTMHKYNGESLTTYAPRGPWSQIHKTLSSLGSVHISNVHILANLEPFRYGSPDFIRKSVMAMRRVHGANGLHLYPQSSYWDWPYTADRLTPSPDADGSRDGQGEGRATPSRLLEMERDWIWYRAWGRYAWGLERGPEAETAYWVRQLGDRFGCAECGQDILEAYNQSGEIAPKLLRRFGITEGNRQTLLLGMFMSQLVNPYKWRVYPGFYESVGPEGEILVEYAEKEWAQQPHIGETPPQIIREVTNHAHLAVEAIERAAPHVQKNKDEFERLRNDMYCYRAIAGFFAEKVKAAMLVLRYQYSRNVTDLDKAVPLLARSLEHYQQLVELAGSHYLYANSMQTDHRKIPIGGDNGTNKTWRELLPHYRKELANLEKHIGLLRAGNAGQIGKKAADWLFVSGIRVRQ